MEPTATSRTSCSSASLPRWTSPCRRSTPLGWRRSARPRWPDRSSTGPTEAGRAGRASRRVPVPTRRIWLPAAAALALLAVGGLIGGALAGRDDGRPDGPGAGTVEYAGPIGQVGGGTGELSVVGTGIGREVHLETDTLEILPTGQFYEVWFVAEDDRPDAPHRISAGTFHPDSAGRSDVRLTAAVDPTKFPQVEVTAEPGPNDPRRTDPSSWRSTWGREPGGSPQLRRLGPGSRPNRASLSPSVESTPGTGLNSIRVSIRTPAPVTAVTPRAIRLASHNSSVRARSLRCARHP
ncbi:MAG: anti-sigma factor [Ilumatobacteraceae bacterium]